MAFFDNHKNLFSTVFLFFAGLTIAVAILPALSNQENNAPLPQAQPLSYDEIKGKKIYIANGCVACHTQQVRNIEMDKVWGSRPSISADYAGITRTDFWRNTATLMGTERTGPDLMDVGNRQPSLDWHLLHLYQPRAVVPESIMPSYQWLFEEKEVLANGDVEVMVPAAFRKKGQGKIVARQDALQLVAYLQSLKQVPLPEGKSTPDFLYKQENTKELGSVSQAPQLDGEKLYATYCQSCHQASGEGVKGAFPALKGSPIVNSDDPQMLIDIILHGYDAREEYGAMPAIGLNTKLSPEEIAAIATHERTSWGNNAKPVTAEEVKQITEYLKTK